MMGDVNNKIIDDVVASFAMDFLIVPNLIIEKVKEEMDIQRKEEKKLVLKNKERL